MSTVTFDPAAILADVARRLNVPAFSATTNVTSGQATYWLQQSQRAFSALLQQALCEDRDYLKTATLATVPNFNLVSLPANCVTVQALIWQKAPNDYRLLKQMQASDLELQQVQTVGNWLSIEPTWRIEGATLDILPPMSTAQTLTLYYTDYLINDGTSTFLSRLDADEWLTLKMCVTASQAKRRDGGQYQAALDQLETRIFATARKRVQAGPHRMRDVYGDGCSDYWRYR